MKPDMSTAVMIEIIRSMAANNQMPEEHFLSAVAARIERLLSSESGSSLELNSIRAMIDIPVTESVQAGVVAELTRLNTELLALRNELAELQKQEPVAEIKCMEDQSLQVVNVNNGFSLGRHPVYAAPVLPAESQLVMPTGLHPDTAKLVTDFASALAEKLYKAQVKYGYEADWKRDGWPSQCQAHFHQHIAKGDPRDVAAYCAFMWFHGWKPELPASQPPAVEKANSPAIPDGWQLVPELPTDEMIQAAFELEKKLFGVGHADLGIYAAMLAAAPQYKDGNA